MTPDIDPPPVPPVEPEPGACCQSGCDPCVYDLYWQAVDRYEQALAAWQARHGISTLPLPPADAS